MNVIVIMADSWRVDHVGCYGNEWIQTRIRIDSQRRVASSIWHSP